MGDPAFYICDRRWGLMTQASPQPGTNAFEGAGGVLAPAPCGYGFGDGAVHLIQRRPQPFRTASGDGAVGSSDVSASGAPSWLLRAKVTAPEPPAGYVRREPLQRHLEGVLERKLTVLRAPAGFGKTTVLADVASRVRGQGLIAGWISLDGHDTPNLFGSYLAAAFEHAGLDVTLLNAHDAWSSSPAVQQIGMLARAIERHAAACLLVLDEVDGLPTRTVQLVDLLVKWAPGDLHVAMTFRSDPGLELAPQVLNGEAMVLGSGRFSVLQGRHRRESSYKRGVSCAGRRSVRVSAVVERKRHG